ncbi:mediator of RNA polymerase II transcription subunit 33A-like [Dorcoceras hygrometricum]|uniref:Mediator of RNA polymerase II transcription subunit 33A-like n=1 Tax=Dorcoceras hygrometricum TaxID=472368 RepID=A0A2Z7BK90_9LAMI|nr:mediator of RNA polymerase II transcription subunit 33A-like [Dorcoceras hygrometricum]
MGTVPPQQTWDGILELTKAAQERGTDPLIWVMQLSSSLNAAGVSMPSVEVAELLVSHICWSNNVPIAWKYLEKALTIRIIVFGTQSSEPGHLIVEFIFAVVWGLLDVSLDDEGLIELTPEKKSRWSTRNQDMEIDYADNFDGKKGERQAALSKINTVIAVELLGEFFQNKVTSGILYLARRNMSMHWECFIHNLRSPLSSASQSRGTIRSELWLPIDLYLEDAISGMQVTTTAAAETLTVVWGLLDVSLDDEGLIELTPEKKSRWSTRNQDMEIDYADNFDGKKGERQAALSKINTVIAVELLGEFFQNKVTSGILYLARRNMPMHWECFIHNLRLLIANSSSLRNSKLISPEELSRLTSDKHHALPCKCKTNSQKQYHLLTARSPLSSASQSRGTIRSELWLPIDLYLEDAISGMQVTTTAAAETLTGLVKALQALNQTTWQDSFLGLWIAALRLVERETNLSEGPIPRLDTCLCMLLSVVVLVIVHIIEEEEITLIREAERSTINQRQDILSVGKRRQDLVSSLQRLNDFEGLLTPPPLVSSLANQAAVKAMMFVSGLPLGDLRHLIVEACIARNVLDTSAYLWPGYVKGHCNQIPRSISGQVPCWSALMKGSPLTPMMVNALVSTPATSLVEIERLYEIALSSTDDEKISAATIFCGASLSRGWNIQEHTALFIVRLLSPAVPTDFSGSESHLIGFARLLNVLLGGISSVDSMQIFCLHGLVPQLAAVLMPICEVFGSCAPNMSWSLSTGEEISSHTVFSNAFNLLLRLWKFDRPPLDHVMGDVRTVGSQLTPEYLLLVHNSQLAAYESQLKNKNTASRLSRLAHPSSNDPIFMDSFPKLKRWYRQHQECIASILSALVPGNPVHQIVEALLNMMFKKINRGGQPLTPTSGSSSSSATGTDDSFLCLKLPAWDILEAVPFVLDAALAACAHGKLTPRELTTGLKDLADFLPASLGTIVSYFSAEVTRGLWKPALMNGMDWPSPAANLSIIENSSSVASNGGVGALLGHGFGSHFAGGLSAVAPGVLYLRVHQSVRNVMFITEEILSLLTLTVKDILNNGIFAWGVDLTSPASKRRPQVLEKHLEFLASALDGKISLGCNKATYRAYVTGYISLMVSCTPAWMLEVDVEVVKRVSIGLKQWNEEDLALSLLGISGIGAMGAAAEMIIETGF